MGKHLTRKITFITSRWQQRTTHWLILLTNIGLFTGFAFGFIFRHYKITIINIYNHILVKGGTITVKKLF